MKKLLGIIGIVVFAMTMYLNTSDMKVNDKTINLISLTSSNIANAESGSFGVNCNCTLLTSCKANGTGAHCAGFTGNGHCQDYNGNC
jgi:hypothetical protein